MNTASVTPSKEKNDFVDWLFFEIFLTLLPIILALLLNWLQTFSFSLSKIIGDGTLVLSAFSISIPSVARIIKISVDSTIPHRKGYKRTGYAALIITVINAIVYASFKTTTSDFQIVFPVSIICLVTSSVVSFIEQSLRSI